MVFRDQIYLPLISVWGGRAHVACAWLCPDEQERDRSRNRAWRGSGPHHCSVMLQIWEMIPFLVKCREGEQGGGRRLGRARAACPALRSDLN